MALLLMLTHAITLRERNEDIQLNYEMMMSPNPKAKSMKCF